jgi:ABC-type phosphate/phosphonate transport system substrate-binding protein
MVFGKRFQLVTVMLLAWSLPGMGLAQEGQTAPSSPMTVLICYPGGSTRSQDAQSATDTMLRVVEEGGDWTAGSLTSLFTTHIKDCKTHLDEEKPQFAITTLGTFLTYREKLNLIPLVQPVINGSSSEKYRIVVRKGTFTSIEELKGKTLGGSFVEETVFLKRVILQGKVDPASFFTLKGSRRALRSLRALVKGDLDAVMVNSQQYRALGSLPFASELEVAFTSEEIPLVGLVANGEKTTADQRNRFLKALAKMCEHRDGKQLCELFGIETFVPADEQAFKKIITLWDAPQKEK